MMRDDSEVDEATGPGVVERDGHWRDPLVATPGHNQGELLIAGRDQLARIYHYFDRNRDRIHYDQYLAAASYPIAFGVIEVACRHGVKDRMERARMHGRPYPAPRPVESTLRGAQRRVGAVQEPSHPKRSGAPLCEHPEPAPYPPGFASSPEPGAHSTAYTRLRFFRVCDD